VSFSGTIGRRCKGARAVASGVMFLLLAVAMVCGTVQTGARYFYCEGLGLASSDPCAQRSDRDERCPFKSFERQTVDCCSVITLPSMPEGARADEATVAPAGVVAVLPAVEDSAARPRSENPRTSQANERWRKPPRSSSERRAQLMVFLT
jgi:hypothetical protein